MPCDDCSKLQRRLEELEAKLAEVIGFRSTVPRNPTPRALPAVPPPAPKNGMSRPPSGTLPSVPKRPATTPPPVVKRPATSSLPAVTNLLDIPIEPPPVSEATTVLPPNKGVNPADEEKMKALGIPEAEFPNAIRALQEYPKGLEIVAPMSLPGPALFHAAYAAEKHGREIVDQVFTQLYSAGLEPADIPHAAEAIKTHGLEHAEIAIQLGYRRLDIVFAAETAKMWPRPQLGRDALQRMKKLFEKARVDIVGEDLRYCAMATINLGDELLERALRDRHPKNEREPWIRGLSIPLVAWAYRMSAPHTGPAIDECRTRGVRREKVGHEVLTILSRKFGRKVSLPPWLGGKQE